MTAHALPTPKTSRRTGGFLLLPFATFAAFLVATGGFVAYVLRPTWPSAPISLDAPPLPVTVAGVLFEVPPAAIRMPVQRHPGPHERIDLAFTWPSLTPPQADNKVASEDLHPVGSTAAVANTIADSASERLFVTIAPLGALLPPAE